jgi:glycosyltransferase involved in cell wall biosynthesis
MIKVLLITETLKPPYDEGIKKTVFNLYKDLKKNYDLKVIARSSFESERTLIVNTNALFYSQIVKKAIQNFMPEVLIYFPFASATFASYLRFRLLSHFAKGAKSILISLQPKPLEKWQEQIVKLIRPGFALTPSIQLKAFWDKINVNSKLLPILTDLNTFKPLAGERSKVTLRKKYNLPEDAFIISHMGHLNKGRNLKSLISVQNAGFQIVVVSSSSTPGDSLGPPSIKQDLIMAGIVVMDKYIPNIREIYQLSDLYIFPVILRNSSISLPLSVLEARACGIPVLTTPFGSLQHFLGDDFGNIYYCNPENFAAVSDQIAKEKMKDRSKTKVAFLNQMYLDAIHNAIND